MHDDRSAANELRKVWIRKGAYWENVRGSRSLALFHDAARRVPAYRDFLKKQRVRPEMIRTAADLSAVPPVNKKNYLYQYPLEKLVWDGSLKRDNLTFAGTSGSTGKPFYFPRGRALDWRSSVYHELFLENNGTKKGQATLVIVGFGMGVWIGGLITYEAFKAIGGRGYRIALLTPGSNKAEILEAVRSVGKRFDQIVLCGYPPFLKDVLEEGKADGISWGALHTKIVFAAEAFSEQFRDRIAETAGIKNIYTDMMNIYGSADLGTMAEETPLSIFMRREAVGKSKVYERLFGTVERLPTFAQFNPEFINFEAPEGDIYCTADNTIPLIRYEIGDRGGVMSFARAAEAFGGPSALRKKAARHGLGRGLVTELPFVHVYERSDLSTKIFGAIIYPEHVKNGLLQASLKKFVTGKFRLVTKHDGHENEYLEVNVELKLRVRGSRSLRARISSAIREALLRSNAEYRYLNGLVPHRMVPRIVFWPYGDPLYFRPGIKQKWV